MTYEQLPIDEIFKTADLLQPMGDSYKNTIQIPQNAIMTGIVPIDEALQGIMPNDFVVAGAATGAGKTALSCKIGASAALAGNKVTLFALEAYEGEISDRIKFPRLAQKWWDKYREPLIYKRWKRGYYNLQGLPEIEAEVIAETPKELMENLHVRYRTNSNYSVDDFLREIKCFAYRNKPDLIVVDHLHYFSLPDDISENKATKKIVNALRDYGLLEEIPIVLFAHMRKKHMGVKTLVPSIDDFHGSSEITKNATVVLTFAPAYGVEMPTQHQFPTYMQVVKDRFNGSIKRYAMMTSFDIRKSDYDKDYRLFTVKNDGAEMDLVEDSRIPDWAEHAKRSGFQGRYGK